MLPGGANAQPGHEPDPGLLQLQASGSPGGLMGTNGFLHPPPEFPIPEIWGGA